MVRQRTLRIIVLGLVALLGTGVARADGEKPLDAWVGRWDLKLRFSGVLVRTTWGMRFQQPLVREA